MKQKIDKMNQTIRKKMVKGKNWMVISITAAVLGLSTYGSAEANATNMEWTARSPEEIRIEEGKEYEIVWGDTLWAISEASGISVETLVDINNIIDRDIIYAGNKITIGDDIVTVKEQDGKKSSFKISEKGNHTSKKTNLIHNRVNSKEETHRKNEFVVEEVQLEKKEIIEEEKVKDKSEKPKDETIKKETEGNPSQEITDEKEEIVSIEKPTLGDSEAARTSKTITKTIPLKPSVEYRDDPELPVGEMRTVEGAAGELVETIIQIIENDTIISEEVVSTERKSSTPTIIYQGTMGLEVVQEEKKERIVETVIEHGEIIQENTEIAQGEVRILQEGINGKRIETYLQYFENNELNSEELINTEVLEAVPRIVEIGTKEIEDEEPINGPKLITKKVITDQPKTIVRESAELVVGKEEVLQEGSTGVTEIDYEVIYENGIEISRTKVATRMISESLPQIVLKGTKEPTIEEKISKEQIEIAQPKTVRRESTELKPGEEKVIQNGHTGVREIVTTIILENGMEVSQEVNETIITEAKPTIIEIGIVLNPTIGTIVEKTETSLEPEIIYNPNMLEGEQKIHKTGSPQIIEEYYEVTYEEGVEVKRELIEKTIIDEGTPELIEKGTLEESVNYSAHAYDSNGQLLINENIDIYDSEILIDSTETDTSGYYMTQILNNRQYDIEAEDYVASVIYENNDFKVDTSFGKSEVGRTITTEQSEVKLKPTVKAYDFTPEEVTFSPDESSVIIDRVLDIKVGETIYIMPEAEYLTGQVFNVKEFETNGEATLIYTAPANWGQLVESMNIDTGSTPISIANMEVYSRPGVEVTREVSVKDVTEKENKNKDEMQVRMFRSAPLFDEQLDYKVVMNVDFKKIFENQILEAITIDDYAFKYNDYELNKDPLEIPFEEVTLKIYGDKIEILYNDMSTTIDKEQNLSIVEGDDFVTYNNKTNDVELNYDQLKIKTEQNNLKEVSYKDEMLSIDKDGKYKYVQGDNSIQGDSESLDVTIDNYTFGITQDSINFSNGDFGLTYLNDNSLTMNYDNNAFTLYNDNTFDIILGDFRLERSDLRDFKNHDFSTGNLMQNLTNYQVSKSGIKPISNTEDSDESTSAKPVNNIAQEMIDRFEGSGNTRVTIDGDMQVFVDIDGFNDHFAYIKQDITTTLDSTINLAFTEQEKPYTVPLATFVLPPAPYVSMDVDLVFDISGELKVITSMNINTDSTIQLQDMNISTELDTTYETTHGSIEGEGKGKLGLLLTPQIGIDNLGAELALQGLILPEISFKAVVEQEVNELTTEGKVDGNVSGEFKMELGFTSDDLGEDNFFTNLSYPIEFKSQEDRTFFTEAKAEIGITGISGSLKIFDETFPIWSFSSNNSKDEEDLFLLLNNGRVTKSSFTIGDKNLTNDFFGDSVVNDYLTTHDNPYDGAVDRRGTYWIVDLDEVISKIGTEYYEIVTRSLWFSDADVSRYALHVNSPDEIILRESYVGGTVELPLFENLQEFRGLPNGLIFNNVEDRFVSNKLTADMVGEHTVYVIEKETITGDETGIDDTVEFHDLNRVYEVDKKYLYNFYIDSFKLIIKEPEQI